MSAIRLAAGDEGAGRVVVLLHAFPLAGAMWQGQVAALRARYRVLTPDLPGFGASPEFEGTPSLDAMADAVTALLDAKGITEPVVLGGLSMGGYVALAFARRHPARLRALILADTKSEPDSPEIKETRTRTMAFVTENGVAAMLDGMLGRLVGKYTLESRSEVVERVRALALAQRPAGVIGALAALRDRPDATPGLKDVQVPALVVVGRDDILTPPSSAQALARNIAGGKLVEIEGAGHLSNLEAPAAFDRAVRDFLDSLG